MVPFMETSLNDSTTKGRVLFIISSFEKISNRTKFLLRMFPFSAWNVCQPLKILQMFHCGNHSIHAHSQSGNLHRWNYIPLHSNMHVPSQWLVHVKLDGSAELLFRIIIVRFFTCLFLLCRMQLVFVGFQQLIFNLCFFKNLSILEISSGVSVYLVPSFHLKCALFN